MEQKQNRGRNMIFGATTEELIQLFRENPHIELECSSGMTRWLKYDSHRKRIGITDNIYYDWFSVEDFRRCYSARRWNYFIM